MMHRRLLETAVEAAATPAEAANSTAEAELSQANFDTNMVIILAALLCALICALGLNSMVRCILRCSRRFGMETAEQTAARISGTGLKKSTLRKIPIFVYGSDHLGSGVEGECPICLGEFVDGDKVRVLPKCNHGFHVNCIDIWLESHSSCPNCRHSLVDSTDSSKSTPPSPLSPPTPPRDAVESDSRQEHMVVEISTFGT